MKRVYEMEKTLLTKKRIISEKITKEIIKYLFVLIAIFLTTVWYMVDESDNFGPIIVFVIVCAIIMVKLLTNINNMYKIKNGDYTVETDILVKCKTVVKNSRMNRREEYYLYFENYIEKVKTDNATYYNAIIGDEFYLINVDEIVYPFNTNYYELDEEVKYNLN